MLSAGSQGTALLQPLPSPYGAADLQSQPHSDDMEPLQNSDSLQNSSTITLADVRHLLPCQSSPREAMELPLDLDDAGAAHCQAHMLLPLHMVSKHACHMLAVDVPGVNRCKSHTDSPFPACRNADAS